MPEALPMAQGTLLIVKRELTDTHCGYEDISLMSPLAHSELPWDPLRSRVSPEDPDVHRSIVSAVVCEAGGCQVSREFVCGV